MRWYTAQAWSWAWHGRSLCKNRVAPAGCGQQHPSSARERHFLLATLPRQLLPPTARSCWPLLQGQGFQGALLPPQLSVPLAPLRWAPLPTLSKRETEKTNLVKTRQCCSHLGDRENLGDDAVGPGMLFFPGQQGLLVQGAVFFQGKQKPLQMRRQLKPAQPVTGDRRP